MARSSNKYKGEELGENLYYGLNSDYAGTGPVDVWYKGEEQLGMKERTGHFTQLVWKNTKEIGCGIFQDAEGGYYVICKYYPAGNYFGEYIKNAFPREDSGDVVEEVVEDPKKRFRTIQKYILDGHNYYRAKPQVGKLERDYKLKQ